MKSLPINIQIKGTWHNHNHGGFQIVIHYGKEDVQRTRANADFLLDGISHDPSAHELLTVVRDGITEAINGLSSIAEQTEWQKNTAQKETVPARYLACHKLLYEVRELLYHRARDTISMKARHAYQEIEDYIDDFTETHQIQF